MTRHRRMRRCCGIPEQLEARRLLAGMVQITEFLAANEGGLADDYGRASDWIEIHNSSDTPVSLAGYRLTDDATQPARWSFPEVTLPGGEFLVVFASGEGLESPWGPGGKLHTNFRLSRAADYLALYSSDGTLLSQFGSATAEYSPQQVNISYGIGWTEAGPGVRRGYFEDPTPGTANANEGLLLDDFVRDTKFSVNRGYFTTPFDLELTTETPGAVIRYTWDGSAPTRDTGSIYSAPIRISATSTVRAAAFKEGLLPTNVDSHTYLFLNNVIRQDGAGLPTTWGTFPMGTTEAVKGDPVPANYAMDPEVVNDPRYRDTIVNDLRSLPALSLVLDPQDLWGEEKGIYVHTMSEGIAWERPVSAELISPDGQTLFQVDAGVRIHGGFGRYPEATAKHSLRLFFRGDYGDAKLDYPWFGESQVSEFNTVVLRANYNYSWARGNRGGAQMGGDYTVVTDRWSAITQQEMGGLASNGTFVHLYINGLYWGIYNPTERPDADFQASHRGGRPEDYDVQNHEGVVDGTASAWSQLLSTVRRNPLNYQAVSELLDVDNFIDYMILNQYGGNDDWPQNNWYASRRRADGERWQFHAWDSEFFFINLNGDRVNTINNEGPGIIYLRLVNDPEFRLRFADRLQKHFFNGGALTVEKNIARLDALAASVDRAVVGESARWGDAWKDQVSPARTRDDDWLPRLKELREDYFPKRQDIVLGQYRRRGLFPELTAPTLSQHGGMIERGGTVSLSSTAVPTGIYFTTDGTDPRLAGGQLSPVARLYQNEPIRIDEATTIKARVVKDNLWSPLTEALFVLRVPGDFNADLAIDLLDLNLLCQAIRNSAWEEPLDLNRDGVLNLDDRDVWLSDVGRATVGDANLDGLFNSTDLIQIFQAGLYEDALPLNARWESGDWTCDGEFDTSDLVAAFQRGYVSE